MSYRLEQTASELSHLVGAQVVSVEEQDFDDDKALAIRFKLARPIDVDGVVSDTLDYQVWQDPEGNGPGYLALTESKPVRS